MADDIQEDVAPSQQNQGDDNKPQGDPSDKLTPEHPRFKQVIEKLHDQESKNQDLIKKIEDLETRINSRQEVDNTKTLTAEESAALDKIDQEFKKRGYVTKKELEESTRVIERSNTLTNLSKEFNGKNGYPRFVSDEVLAYARKHGFGDNYKAAYRDMHFDALVQIEGKRKTVDVPDSERPSGGERNAPTNGFSADDIKSMSDEDYEKNRTKIMNALRPH